jgi:hypothetical protein
VDSIKAERLAIANQFWLDPGIKNGMPQPAF